MTFLDSFFYINSALIIFSTVLALTAPNAVHGLLYFILSIIALSVNFYLLGAWVASALEVMVYAGAIMVLFVFVVMLLNIKYEEQRKFKNFAGPGFFALILIVELFLVTQSSVSSLSIGIISIKDLSISIFRKYNIGLEIASLILLTGLIGALHLGRKRSSS